MIEGRTTARQGARERGREIRQRIREDKGHVEGKRERELKRCHEREKNRRGKWMTMQKRDERREE